MDRDLLDLMSGVYFTLAGLFIVEEQRVYFLDELEEQQVWKQYASNLNSMQT